jgi:hypothetical protein
MRAAHLAASAGLVLAAVFALGATDAKAQVNVPCTAMGAPANTVCFNTNNAEIGTSTDAELQNVTTTTNSQTIDTFQTEFVGLLQGGPDLIEEIFSVPFGDPSLSSVDAQIEAALTSDASGPLSFSGPTLTSNVQTTTPSSNTVINSTTVFYYVAVGDDVFGPVTLNYVSSNPLFYSNDVTCTGLDITTPATTSTPGVGVPTGCTSTGPDLFVVAGQTDVNIFDTNVTDIDQTTTDTNTVLTTQIYDIVGIPEASGPTAVPEPITISIFGAGLVGAVAMRRRKKAKQV